MQKVVFVDLEVNPQNNNVLDFGIINSEGISLHNGQKTDFQNFIKDYDFICGHNIINHDSKYFDILANQCLIDTLYFSPLLFAEKPYHNLLKDDKIISDELNNPLNDSIKAQNLFYDEINAFKNLDEYFRQILINLLYDIPEFYGFFKFLECKKNGNTYNLLIDNLKEELCINAPLNQIIENNPIELAYTLAIISTKDRYSIIPHWVHKKFPLVETIIRILRNTPCNNCEYCRNMLNPHIHLKNIFGYDDFRKYEGEPLQELAVKSAVNNKSLLAIFPTGGGKSLTFQLPALIAGITERALTVVISPLQSLMKDQVDNLEKRGIVDAVTINGLLNPIERQEAIERVENGIATLLYISPESLRSKTIEKLFLSRQIARFVIDEAHCFSAWGQDFRVDYLYIGDYIKELCIKKGVNQIPVSCFTATAKQKVVSDIKDYFKEKLNIDLELYSSNATRTNLHYQVLFKETEDEKYATLRDLITTKNCPTIVYVSRTKRTLQLAEKLCSDGIKALAFNGKMESKEKQKNQDDFINDKVQVMVATSAFGMGVDKSNVKLVVHFDISDSLENYVQEAGRAGRNPSLEAECYVLYNDSDLDKHFILNNQTKLSLSEINQIWKAIKNLTRRRSKICSSALEIAREAGWDDEVGDIETRVKTALQALENAGYIQRGKNSPHVYATSILVKNFDEASKKIDSSSLFYDKDLKDKAKRVIKSLISSKYIANAGNQEAESRVDYIADILGIEKRDVISVVETMRQEKILKDDRDISAYIDNPKDSHKTLKIFKDLDAFLLDNLKEDGICVNLKQLNENAEKLGLKSNIKSIKTILLFWKIKSYIKLSQDSTDSVIIEMELPLSLLREKQNKMFSVASYIVNFLIERYSVSTKNEDNLILFSIIELLNGYNSSLYRDSEIDIYDIEEALLFLAKINSMKIEGGFIVLYMGLNIDRLNKNNRQQYTKEDYKQLNEFYQHKIQQIHIVGEFANMMVKNYDSALKFVKDYFQLDYKKFLATYFKGERLKEIQNNITPQKYNELFGTLSEKQTEIIKDDDSQYIVVAAGPGSGKTRVLVHKLASLLLLEDIKHEQLLMLTFSRAAALEFKQRLFKLIGNAASFVEIKTFHSYCFDLIGQIGKLEDAKTVVKKASEMILAKEVEISKITKTVLVIDEAQDMDTDEFNLVESLIEINDNLRIIAVGDDDQNIYEFRGSSSKNFQQLITKYNAKQYDLIDNYRSTLEIVKIANTFSMTISDRMKSSEIVSKSKEKGNVVLIKHNNSIFENGLVDDLIKNYKTGSCCVLTSTNQEALTFLGILNHKKIKAKLIQSNDSFDLYNIVELRFFMKAISKHSSSPKISDSLWEYCKKELIEKYSNSKCINLIISILDAFELNYKYKYLSDLNTFLHESKLEDFLKTEQSTIMISTIHKSKGREFDNVYMYLNNTQINNDEDKRRLYVGMTRTKSQLHIHYNLDNLDFLRNSATELYNDNNIYEKPAELIVDLTHKDIALGFFKDKKQNILKLLSGQELEIYQDMLLYNNMPVLKFSKLFSSKLIEYKNIGYKPSKAIIKFILSWFCDDDNQEYAIILPRLIFDKI
ncbi:MAG: RecQ family ATP-dependent DNA helicase [Bacteroidales bacterium]|nr:RecQ family ATP-dependent DNA helicase [Bacteroidales bacterium]